MIDFEKGVEMMDKPEIIHRLFFPRRESSQGAMPANGMNHIIRVAPGITICCRFYRARWDGPNLLYFHGNGETAPDYDYVAPVYSERGLNLFVADYRGYGLSDGNPTCSSMIKDAHPTFEGFVGLLRTLGHRGDLFVMGRSLGSAPAIEVAYHYQERLKGLIVESGFAGARNQWRRLGVTHLFPDGAQPIGFGNDLKIQGVSIQTLIIHGEGDEVIPVEEGRTLYELSGASQKFSLFVAGAGHNDLMLRALDDYMNAVEHFIRQKGHQRPSEGRIL